jgi:hypothetical protein
MILLGFFLQVMFFLLVGAVVFLIFLAFPFARRFALSAALWCAAWGPCLIAFQMLAGLSIAADALAKRWTNTAVTLPPLPAWRIYALLALLGTAMTATVASWLHQMLIGRITFALFRLYATVVIAGIGGVFGMTLAIWLVTLDGVPYRWPASLAAMVVLPLCFGFAGFRWARFLRGKRPKKMQWVTQEEFEGRAT